MKTIYNTVLISTLLSLPICTQALEATTNTDSATSQASTLTTVYRGTAPGFHMTLNAGLTYGGDTIGTVIFTDGSTKHLKGGALYQFGIGGLYQFENKPVALMLSANYHFDSITAKNGNASFDRFPIEALAYYTGKEKFRFGGGIRIINGAELSTNIGGSDKYTFDTTRGFVAEVGYQLDPHGWLNFRFVSEKYQAKTRVVNGTTRSMAGSVPADGSHMGVNFTYEF